MKGQVNFKRFKKRAFSIGVSAVLVLFFLNCSDWRPAAHGKRLSDHPFDPKSPLIERIKPIPETTLNEFKKLDGRQDYAAYMPNALERAVIADTLASLPPLNAKIMKERLAAIYFVSGFISAGCTDWLLNEGGEIYAYIIINSDTLKMSVDELLLKKEKTCFAESGGSEIKISVSQNKKGFLYIMLHESCHAVDYVTGLTPFTEPDVQSFRVPKKETPFTRGIWRSYYESAAHYKFREHISFYQEPRLQTPQAESIYKELSASPFISLYGSLNWAEDLCELLAFYHLTEKMGMGYKIEIRRHNKTIFFIEPARGKQIKERFKNLNVFYESSPLK